MKILCLLVPVIIISISSSHAQDWHFEEESDIRLPSIHADGWDVGVGDIDSDGDLDIGIACGDVWGPPYIPGFEQIYFNDGSGFFTLADSSWFFYRNNSNMIFKFLDVDRDGDLDAFVGSSGMDTAYIAINDGNGIFQRQISRTSFCIGPVEGATWGDIDEDGDIDIFVSFSHNGGQFDDMLLINNGQGYFRNSPDQFPQIGEVFGGNVNLVDLDGDLDLDLLYIPLVSPARIYINDEAGYFTDQTQERIQADSCGFASAVVDVNNDGFLDILVSKKHSGCALYINDGSGHFTDESSERLLDPPSLPFKRISAGDINNDGWVDFIWSGGDSNHPDSILVNVNGGYFESQTAQRMPDTRMSSWGSVIADLDGDGDNDYFRTGDYDNINRLFINTLNNPDSIAPEILGARILPGHVSFGGPYPIRIGAIDGVSISSQLKCLAYYSISGSPFVYDSLAAAGGYIFEGVLPAIDSGQWINYYYLVQDKEGNSAYYPAGAPDTSFTITYDNLSDVSGGNSAGPLLSAFQLSAYPNPFNSSTTIRINHDTPILIYDITGRRIAMLHTEQGKAVWDASNIPSGIYFARAQTGKSEQSIKLILMK
jgi:hypothetical protein